MAQVKPNTTTKIIVNNATISSAETPPSTQSAQTSVTAILNWGMGFPLPGYTPYTAPVSAVMDNSVLERSPIEFYAPRHRDRTICRCKRRKKIRVYLPGSLRALTGRLT